MDLTITPTKLHGAVTPPPSKSQAHRLLIAAALSGGVSTIHNLADSQDIAATRRCLAALGARIDELGAGMYKGEKITLAERHVGKEADNGPGKRNCDAGDPHQGGDPVYEGASLQRQGRE